MVAAHPDGASLRVWAVPGASRERVVGRHDGALKIAVAAPPDKGKANQAIAAVLAAALGVPTRAIELLAGRTSREKHFLVRGLDPAVVSARLDALAGR